MSRSLNNSAFENVSSLTFSYSAANLDEVFYVDNAGNNDVNSLNCKQTVEALNFIDSTNNKNLTSEINSLNSEVSTLQNEFNQLQAQINTINSEISTLQTEYNSLQTSINSLNVPVAYCYWFNNTIFTGQQFFKSVIQNDFLSTPDGFNTQCTSFLLKPNLPVKGIVIASPMGQFTIQSWYVNTGVPSLNSGEVNIAVQNGGSNPGYVASAVFYFIVF